MSESVFTVTKAIGQFMRHKGTRAVIARQVGKFVVIVLCAGIGACGARSETEETRTAGNAPSVPKKNTSSPAELFDEMFMRSREPVLVSVPLKAGEGASEFCRFVFRSAATPQFTEMSASELLLAYTPRENLGEVDLVSDSTGFAAKGSRILPGSPVVCSWVVRYEELRYFRSYYREFMAKNKSPLRRQAEVSEFMGALLNAHQAYRDSVEATKQMVFRTDIPGLTVDETYYNVKTGNMVIPLDGYRYANMIEKNTVLYDLVMQINGAVDCLKSWHEFVGNFDDLAKVTIPMSIDEAEQWVAATRAEPGHVMLLFKNSEMVDDRCTRGSQMESVNHSTMGIRIVGVRFHAGPESKMQHTVMF